MIKLPDDKLKESVRHKYYKALSYSADLLTPNEIENF